LQTSWSKAEGEILRDCTRLSSRKGSNGSLIVITPRLISDHLIFILTVHSSPSPAMSSAKKEAQSSRDLPFRQGALRPEKIRAECPQFRILIIGKANAGKTTILRKVCNAKPDAKPIVCDAEGKEVRQEVPGQQDPTKVRHGNFAVLTKLTKNLGHCDSLDCSRCLRFFDETREILQMSSTLLLRLSKPKPFYNYF
jgi:hypothetical protein